MSHEMSQLVSNQVTVIWWSAIYIYIIFILYLYLRNRQRGYTIRRPTADRQVIYWQYCASQSWARTNVENKNNEKNIILRLQMRLLLFLPLAVGFTPFLTPHKSLTTLNAGKTLYDKIFKDHTVSTSPFYVMHWAFVLTFFDKKRPFIIITLFAPVLKVQ